MSYKVYHKTCAWCGQSFTAGRCDARYCGTKCRSAVYRQRQRVLKLAQEAMTLLAEVEFHALDREIESGAVEQLKIIRSQADYALSRVGSDLIIGK